jgi:cupin fold WbuC family metalloprotein
MNIRRESEEVLYSIDEEVKVGRPDVESFTREAALTSRRRIRLCAHDSVENTVHEMIIVHPRDAYVRPHRHPGKPESLHVIDGEVDIVLFDEHGEMLDVYAMGDYASRKPFFHRLTDAKFHTLIIRSEWLTFHEVTSGPFSPTGTEFALWSPGNDELDDIALFQDVIKTALANNELINIAEAMDRG